ncbi:MAG TPA: FAD-dependent oxidoreductase [Acidimicrobiia bacterium]|nr:FAD-dependent oxidoreductase [Acidimicrobiia bacterium]
MHTDANVVVIGAGIVGTSVAYHLVDMGVEGVVVVDKGDLDHNDGSTSHAPGGLRTLTASHFFTTLGIASREVYDRLPLAIDGVEQFYRTGNAQIASTRERFDSHKRLHEKGLSHGIESHLLSPADVAALLPIVDPGTVVGGIHIPSSGVVNTSLLATSMRRVAETTGRARFYGETEVTDLEIVDGRLVGVVTQGELGTIRCEQAVVCTNIWAPLLAEQAGIPMPLFPGEHQYIYTEAVPALAGRSDVEVTMPVTAFDDLSVYFRQHGDRIGIGSYAHEARLVDPHDLPATAVLPFTPDDFTDAWEAMRQHMPALRETEIAEGFNGMFSFTVDGHPMLGETPVAGLWSAVGAWLSFASEVGRVMARWMTTGDPGMDVTVADVNRFHAHQSNRQFLSRQAKYFYEIGFEDLHPTAVASSVRHVRHAPYHQRFESLGAEFVPFAGQEAPLFYAANARLVDKHRDAIPMRTGYDAIGWSPIMGAEHLEMRANVALVDWSAAIAPLEVSGPGALAHLQYLCTADVDLPVGGVTYSLVLTPSGGIARDLTVARMSEDTWWILTGRGNLPAELALFSSLAPDDGSVRYVDRSAGLVGIGLWGPNARTVLESVTGDDVSNDSFPWYTWRAIDVGMAPVTAVRLSYVGELGWEFYVTPAMALHVWDTLWEAGRAVDMPAVGAKSVFSARLEKGYRLWGSDMTPEYTPSESGVAWAMQPSKGFRGKDAALAAPVRRRVVTLRFAGDAAVVYGWEPVFAGDDVVGFIAAGEYGYSVGAFLAHAFIDADRARPGTEVEVQRTGRRHPATIVTSPLLDPTNERLKS